jgi:hypothetical protein
MISTRTTLMGSAAIYTRRDGREERNGKRYQYRGREKGSEAKGILYQA